jgi:hypothetical protein
MIGYASSTELAAALPFMEKACSLGSASGCSSLAWVMARSPVSTTLPEAKSLRQARLTAAYFAALGGRRDEARALAEPLLRHEDAAAARMLLACIALDQGMLDEAEHLHVPLEKLSPPDPAAGVLAQLILRRRQRNEAWPDAMVEAVSVR